tara:strand:- start:1804 stop:2034 length:231 start_codon:yes stop_codon:yes gene_type:complete
MSVLSEVTNPVWNLTISRYGFIISIFRPYDPWKAFRFQAYFSSYGEIVICGLSATFYVESWRLRQNKFAGFLAGID